jgi:hypothetical protein
VVNPKESHQQIRAGSVPARIMSRHLFNVPLFWNAVSRRSCSAPRGRRARIRSARLLKLVDGSLNAPARVPQGGQEVLRQPDPTASAGTSWARTCACAVSGGERAAYCPKTLRILTRIGYPFVTGFGMDGGGHHLRAEARQHNDQLNGCVGRAHAGRQVQGETARGR